jgi:hypothetical protein
MLARFERLTLEGIGKRVYQLKDMTKRFAKKVFPAGWYTYTQAPCLLQ